jgi:hypothetical protein
VITVKCAACHTEIGYCQNMDDVDSLAHLHDPECSASDEEKHSAAVELRLRNFLAQEGLDQ